MLKRNRLYTRREPDKDATVFYLFCEGNVTEPQYFNFFAGLDSKIKLEIIPAGQHDRNSPDGLYEKASSFLVKTIDNPNPKYDLADVDKVWFVIDTDEWKDKIDRLRKACQNHQNWLIAQSNPCFEIWLYYHFHSAKPDFKEVEGAKGMKAFLNLKVNGGFDSRKHAIHIQTAIINSEQNFEHINQEPVIFSTNMHELAGQILPLVKSRLNYILDNIK